jgi:hypothetical protein
VDLLRASRITKVACCAQPSGLICKCSFFKVENCFSDQSSGVVIRLEFFLDHALAGASAARKTHHQHFAAWDGFDLVC